jgi:protein-L-isoaspartate(D-aspartate) O-methyltransferase
MRTCRAGGRTPPDRGINVSLLVGDAATPPTSLIQDQQYDVIVLTGSVPLVPEAYLSHLTLGGRIFAIVGDAPAMKAELVDKTGEATFATTELFETVIPPLIHARSSCRDLISTTANGR